jgi:hypothetical protein
LPARYPRSAEAAIRYVTAIRVDALTLVGEYLKRGPKAKGGQPYRATCTQRAEVKPTLRDLGIHLKESAEAQALAELKVSDPRHTRGCR